MAALFLSYSREDAERVQPLAVALEREGHSAWWDRHISGGQEFAGAIEQALASADVVIVCWSQSSIRSDWVRDEAAAGRDSGRLVPVSLDGCPPPLGFRQYHTIDLSGWNGRLRSRALQPLKAAITEKANDASPHARPADAPPVRQRRSNFEAHRWSVAAAAVLVLIFGGIFLYSRVWAGDDRIAPRVAIGQFALVSADLPRALPDMLGQEILAAFGAENAVAVVTAGDGTAGLSAPFVMDGGVSRLADSVRFTVNLKNRRSGLLLWSGAYEHEVADAVAARQAAVGASQVVRCGLWGASSYKSRMSDQALSLYFKWCTLDKFSSHPAYLRKLILTGLLSFDFGTESSLSSGNNQLTIRGHVVCKPHTNSHNSYYSLFFFLGPWSRLRHKRPMLAINNRGGCWSIRITPPLLPM